MAMAAAVTVVQVASVGTAFANAANPNPDTTGTATVNADGTVSAQVSGTWSWPGQTCEGRYGEGWAVDWWGVSTSSTPSPSFSLTDATEVTAPGTTTTGTVSPAGAIPIPGGTFFHVGQYYAGEVVNSSSTCTDTGSGGSAGSTGSWSASATYPSMSDVPPAVCVNMYDEHGSEGKPSGNPNDFSPSQDNDNSIQTNHFNPSDGYCVALQVTPHLSLRVAKLNDANGSGAYARSETAKSAGQAVPFEVKVKNTSSVTEVVVGITDQWPGMAPFSLDSECNTPVNVAPGQTVSCFWTQPDYAPPAGQSLTNTVKVSVEQQGNPGNTATGRATSTVTTPAPPPKPGWVEICENAPKLTGTFTFTFAGLSQTVPVNACGPAVKVPSGQLTIVQTFRPQTRLTSVTTTPSNRLVSVSLRTRAAVVTIVPGRVSTETIVTWTNVPVSGEGTIKVCAVAGRGVSTGTEFTFTVGGTTVVVPSGPAPGGYCEIAGSFHFPSVVTVTETIPAGDKVSSIAVRPGDRESGPPDLATGTVNVSPGPGVTEVTYKNTSS